MLHWFIPAWFKSFCCFNKWWSLKLWWWCQWRQRSTKSIHIGTEPSSWSEWTPGLVFREIRLLTWFFFKAGGIVAARVDPAVGLDHDRGLDLEVTDSEIASCYKVFHPFFLCLAVKFWGVRSLKLWGAIRPFLNFPCFDAYGLPCIHWLSYKWKQTMKTLARLLKMVKMVNTVKSEGTDWQWLFECFIVSNSLRQKSWFCWERRIPGG